jgi:type IV pilus assembly protein PilP
MRSNIRPRSFAASLTVIVLAMATVMAQTTGSTTSTTTAGATTTSGTGAASTSAGEKNVQQTLQEILEEPTSGDAYRYDPQGRRDPFQSLVGPAPKLDQSKRPAGVPGFLIDEMKLQGIVKTRQGLVAMIGGPDNKGYVIRVGDKTFDGEVIRIMPSSVVFRQEVNDPTRIERYREVVKELGPEAPRK